jgi:hypothetical protein
MQVRRSLGGEGGLVTVITGSEARQPFRVSFKTTVHLGLPGEPSIVQLVKAQQLCVNRTD